MNKLKQLETKDNFASLLGFKNSKYINYILYSVGTDHLYKTFSIPKKNGGERIIHAPKEKLKRLQRKLAAVLWDCYVESLEIKSKNLKFQLYHMLLRKIKVLLQMHRYIEIKNMF